MRYSGRSRDWDEVPAGFGTLARLINKPSESLLPMLSSKGNPSMDNLAAIFGALLGQLRVDIEVHAADAA